MEAHEVTVARVIVGKDFTDGRFAAERLHLCDTCGAAGQDSAFKYARGYQLSAHFAAMRQSGQRRVSDRASASAWIHASRISLHRCSCHGRKIAARPTGKQEMLVLPQTKFEQLLYYLNE